jgi:hypothetical protein
MKELEREEENPDVRLNGRAGFKGFFWGKLMRG